MPPVRVGLATRSPRTSPSLSCVSWGGDRHAVQGSLRPGRPGGPGLCNSASIAERVTHHAPLAGPYATAGVRALPCVVEPVLHVPSGNAALQRGVRWANMPGMGFAQLVAVAVATGGCCRRDWWLLPSGVVSAAVGSGVCRRRGWCLPPSGVASAAVGVDGRRWSRCGVDRRWLFGVDRRDPGRLTPCLLVLLGRAQRRRPTPLGGATDDALNPRRIQPRPVLSGTR